MLLYTFSRDFRDVPDTALPIPAGSDDVLMKIRI